MDTILYTAESITIDFFTAFGLYSMLYMVVAIFTRKPFVNKTDLEANRFISFIGIVYIVIWTAASITEYCMADAGHKFAMMARITGKYWFGFWIQPFLWFTLTQLLRITIFRKNMLLRFLCSILLLFSIERIVIIISSLHRDYLPSSWTMYNSLGIYPSNLALMIILKLMVFLSSVLLFRLITIKVRKLQLFGRHNK